MTIICLGRNTFQTHYVAYTLPIFAKLNIIKFSDLISLCNYLFIFKHFISKPASVFSHVFILASNTHEQNTRFASHGLLTKPTCNTSKYGTNAFAVSAIASWNFFQREFLSNNLRQISYSQLKVLIKNYFFNSYNQISFWKYGWFFCLRLFCKYLEGRLFFLICMYIYMYIYV